MLSVRSRDEGLGFGAMDENDVEEGEALSVQDDHDYVDPDVALSYIGEKLQNVLGYCQKDFEGGVSAENLGAMFGGYGSFLPSYQRSPSILTQPKSSPPLADHTVSRSPCNSVVEGAIHNSPIVANVSVSRNNTASTDFVEKLLTSNLKKSSLDAGRCVQQDHGNKTVKMKDQKSLKVRLKVGPKNSLVPNNAAIYSGLGLDDCLSSSPEDSPDGSGGISPEFLDSACGSPLKILEVMTCFVVPGGFLLSPLHEHLFSLSEKESKFRRSTMHQGIPANSTIPTRESDALSSRKVKADEKNGRLAEESLYCKSKTSRMLEKEIDIETPAGRKLLSEALNIPILFSSKETGERAEDQTVAESSNSSDVAKYRNKSLNKNVTPLSDILKHERIATTESLKSIGLGSENESTYAKGKVNSKINLVDKTPERPVGNYKDALSDYPRESKSKSLLDYDINRMSSDVHKEKNGLPAHARALKQVTSQLSKSLEKDGTKMLQGLDQMPEGKDKVKGRSNNCVSVTESTKEKQKAPSTVVPKEKQGSPSRGGRSEKKSKVPKSRKDTSRSHSREPNGEAVRIVNDGRAENMDNLLEGDESKEKSKLKNVGDVGVGFSKQLTNTMTGAPSIGNVPASDAASALHAPVLIKENWVECDKCQKWRLLPYETDPHNLPKKWKCSMQVWLPGLNRCSISEEQTQKAFNELYMVPAPGTGSNLNAHHDVVAPSMASLDVPHIDQRHEHVVGSSPVSRKKKHRHTSNLPNHVSSKNNLQAPSKNKRSSDVTEYPLEANLSKKAEVESTMTFNQIQRQKDQHKIPGQYSDAGDSMEITRKLLKSKNKREFDKQGVRASKKHKEGASPFPVEDQQSDLDKAARATYNGSSVNGRILQSNINNSFSKDSTVETRGNLASIRMSKDLAHVFPNVELNEQYNTSVMERSGTVDFAYKKRKLEWQESKGEQNNVVTTQAGLNDGKSAKRASDESNFRKQKKAKAPAYEQRELTVSDTDENVDKKGHSTMIKVSRSREIPPVRLDEGKVATAKEQKGHHHEPSSQRAIDSAVSLKNDPQFPAAATSSSSKVSGSCKSKSKIQELKGSPVESVSSSPLRICNSDKVSSKSYAKAKDGAIDVGPPFTGSPKRCSDGEVDGGSNRYGTLKTKSSSGDQLRSLEGQRAIETGISGSVKEKHTYKEPNRLHGVMDQSNKYHSEVLEKDNLLNQDKLPSQQHADDSTRGKPDKTSNLSSRERNKNADVDRITVKTNDSIGGKKDLYSIKGNGNCHFDDEFNCDEKSTYQKDMGDKNYNAPEKDEDCLGKTSSTVKRLNANSRTTYSDKEIEFNMDVRSKDNNSKATVAGYSSKHGFQENIQPSPSCPGEQPSGIPDRIDQLEMAAGRGTSKSVKPSTNKQEAQSWPLQKVPTPIKGSREQLHPSDGVGKSRKADNQSIKQAHSLRQATPNRHGSASPMRKDGPSTSHLLREARDLKHTADRLKKEGLEHESIGICFESGLKFLLCASLMEPSSVDTRHGDLKELIHMYTLTAGLFMYCAHGYERFKEMAAVALSYKCAEVAYMKAAYYKNPAASKDRHELQTAFQSTLPGESPSSSASDVDNLNNQGALDKATPTKPMASPQVTGNFVIAARNHAHFMGLLNYTNDLIAAFDATKRSHSAMAAASASQDMVRGDGLSKVREVLDFSYHNIEELLRLVRLAVVLIS